MIFQCMAISSIAVDKEQATGCVYEGRTRSTHGECEISNLSTHGECEICNLSTHDLDYVDYNYHRYYSSDRVIISQSYIQYLWLYVGYRYCMYILCMCFELTYLQNFSTVPLKLRVKLHQCFFYPLPALTLSFSVVLVAW